MTRRGHEFDDIELVLRVIHTIQQAMTHHRSYQSRYTGESRCPLQKWIPAPCSLPGAGFAGKARRGRRASGINQTEGLRRPFFSSPPRKRGPRATGAVPAALDARFRGHDGEVAECRTLEADD